MKRHIAFLHYLVTAATLGTLACQPPMEEDPDDLASVRVALTQVPADVRCVRFTITVGGSSIVRTFTVAPASMPTLAMTALPSGPATFLPEAFNIACSSVVAASVPSWVAAPINATLAPGEIVNLAFMLRPGAGANATLDFVSIGVTPAAQNFGSVTLAQLSAPVTFTIRNIGATPTGTLDTILAGPDASQFSVLMNGCTTLAAGATCSLQVQFAPTAAGSRSATLGVSGSPGGSVTSTLAGTGVGLAQLSISPATMDFGTVAIGITSPIQTFNITNTGASNTGLLSVALTGPNTPDFQLSMSSCAGVSLPPMGSCSVGVRFLPATAGAKSAVLTIQGPPGGATVSGMVRGSGAAAARFSFAPAARDFGIVAVGATSPGQSFTITNTGGLASGSPTVTLSDSTNFAIANTTCLMPLPPMASCTATVRFSPATVGTKNGTLTVTAMGTSGTASLTGSGN